MLYELQGLNLKLCIKQYNENFVLPLIVAPQLSSGWQHKYSTKTRPAGRTNEQSMYSPMSLQHPLNKWSFTLVKFFCQKRLWFYLRLCHLLFPWPTLHRF